MTEHEYLTGAEVAELLRVDPKTLARWDQAGRFIPGTVARTPGGHRRYKREKIMALIGQENEK